MLTHVDQNQLPTMVDVSDKKITVRTAVAESCIQLPEELREHFKNNEISLKKGPVFQTAIIAGTMAAKRTHEFIPFCHPITIESCKLSIEVTPSFSARIRCAVKTEGKTGVEMEALHGASVAALTIYDMCKAVSHRMVIGDTKLISKTGGKRTVFEAPLYGLVLTGGKSTRMQQDKALLNYNGTPQAERAFQLLSTVCEKVYLSARKDQWAGTRLDTFPTLTDQFENLGPVAGILSAFEAAPNANWFIVACDLPKVTSETLHTLLDAFDPSQTATCYVCDDGEFPEALCAIYTPHAHTAFREAAKNDRRCPVKILKQNPGKFLKPASAQALDNVNTPEEYQLVLKQWANTHTESTTLSKPNPTPEITP